MTKSAARRGMGRGAAGRRDSTLAIAWEEHDAKREAEGTCGYTVQLYEAQPGEFVVVGGEVFIRDQVLSDLLETRVLVHEQGPGDRRWTAEDAAAEFGARTH